MIVLLYLEMVMMMMTMTMTMKWTLAIIFKVSFEIIDDHVFKTEIYITV